MLSTGHSTTSSCQMIRSSYCTWQSLEVGYQLSKFAVVNGKTLTLCERNILFKAIGQTQHFEIVSPSW
jgi:hypothetical protein